MNKECEFGIKDCNLNEMHELRKKGNLVIEIIRSKKHVLSPSWGLLNEYKENLKKGHIEDAWGIYESKFFVEMKSKEAKDALNHLAKVESRFGNGMYIYLACFEKDNKYCHRRLVIEMIKNLKEMN